MWGVGQGQVVWSDFYQTYMFVHIGTFKLLLSLAFPCSFFSFRRHHEVLLVYCDFDDADGLMFEQEEIRSKSGLQARPLVLGPPTCRALASLPIRAILCTRESRIRIWMGRARR